MLHRAPIPGGFHGATVRHARHTYWPVVGGLAMVPAAYAAANPAHEGRAPL